MTYNVFGGTLSLTQSINQPQFCDMVVPLVVALVLLLTHCDFTSWVGSLELRSWLMCQGDAKEEEDMSVDSDEEPQSYPITTPLSHQSKNMKPPPSKLKVSSAQCILLLGVGPRWLSGLGHCWPDGLMALAGLGSNPGLEGSFSAQLD